MFQLTLMGKSDAVIESFFINMHARCVQVLKNGSESRGFNLGKLKKKKKQTYHWNLIWPAWQAFERKGEVNWRAPFALLMRARNHVTLPFRTPIAHAKTDWKLSIGRCDTIKQIVLPVCVLVQLCADRAIWSQTCGRSMRSGQTESRGEHSQVLHAPGNTRLHTGNLPDTYRQHNKN